MTRKSGVIGFVCVVIWIFFLSGCKEQADTTNESDLIEVTEEATCEHTVWNSLNEIACQCTVCGAKQLHVWVTDNENRVFCEFCYSPRVDINPEESFEEPQDDEVIVENNETDSQAQEESISETKTQLRDLRRLGWSQTNEEEGDMVYGDWYEYSGTCMKDSLRFWVVHGPGWGDTESVTYDLRNSSGTLELHFGLWEQSDIEATTYFNIYIDDEFVGQSKLLSNTSPVEVYTISLNGNQKLMIECRTNVGYQAYGLCNGWLIE